MSTVHVTLVEVTGVGSTGEQIPVASTRLIGTPQAMTSGASAQSTVVANSSTINADRVSQYFWRIAVAGTDNVYAAFGADPTASSTTGYLLPAPGVYEFRVYAINEKVAIANA